MIELAAKFGVSDRGLAKICKKHRVPRPPMGFFLMKGRRKPEKPALPIVDDARLEEISIHATVKEREIQVPPEVEVLIQAEQEPDNKVVVAPQLRDPSPIVAVARLLKLDEALDVEVVELVRSPNRRC